MKALITGSAGLVGSACVELLCEHGWEVAGVDSNARAEFFGPAGSTAPVIWDLLKKFLKQYRHQGADIRDRHGIETLVRAERPDFIIHAAAQPSHDKAAEIAFDDFDTNAVGTLNLLEAARRHCPATPFCFTSTNKVYGDRPNLIPMVEEPKRYAYADCLGVAEEMPVDQCLHSLFGASKLAADVLCQEYGRYFNMPVGVFRGGCLTGPQHAAVPLHGYLAYIVECAVTGKPYTIHGYKGKQVRDQLHARDVASLFLEFYEHPRCGEVYNMGGGRENSISILETIDALAAVGHHLKWEYSEAARKGDHICYVTDLSKVRTHYPNWTIEHDLESILTEVVCAKAEGVHA